MERFLAAVGPRAGLIELLAGDAAVLGGLARLCARRRSPDSAPHHAARAGDGARRSTRVGAPQARPRFPSGDGAGVRPGVGRSASSVTVLRQLKQAEELAVVWRYLLA